MGTQNPNSGHIVLIIWGPRHQNFMTSDSYFRQIYVNSTTTNWYSYILFSFQANTWKQLFNSCLYNCMYYTVCIAAMNDYTPGVASFPGLPHFSFSVCVQYNPLPCIILSANQSTQMGEACMGTRLHQGLLSSYTCTCSTFKLEVQIF